MLITGNKIINITLLLIVIGLTTVALLKPELLPSRTTEQLTDINPNHITSININQPESKIQLYKSRGNWYVWYNSQYIAADEELVKQIINLASKTTLSNFNNTPEELEKFGITQSTFSVEFNNTLIKYGNSEPFANRHYVYTDDKIHIVGDHILYRMKAPVTDFIARTVIPQSNQVTNLKILWKQRPPVKLASEMDSQFLYNWQMLEAKQVEPYQDEEKIAIAVLQINAKDIIDFGIVSTKNTLKLSRKDLGITYIVPKQYITGLLTFTPPRFQ